MVVIKLNRAGSIRFFERVELPLQDFRVRARVSHFAANEVHLGSREGHAIGEVADVCRELVAESADIVIHCCVSLRESESHSQRLHCLFVR